MTNTFLSLGLSTERDISNHFNVLRVNAEQDFSQGKINAGQRDIKVLELKKEALQAIVAVHSGKGTGASSLKVPLGRIPPAGPGPVLNMWNPGLSPAQIQSILNNLPRLVGSRDDMVFESEPTFVPEQTFGEITAFRVWRICNKTGLLTSSFKIEHTWHPQKVLEAHAKPLPHDSSDWSEKVGIHAWKSVFEVAEYAKGFLVDPYGQYGNDIHGAVIGRVHLWGEVIEHERGYRAEFAKIISIDDCVGQDGKWDGQELERLQGLYFPKEGQEITKYSAKSKKDRTD